MNEENYSAPEEQKEKKMKKLIFGLIAVALIVIVGVACTQLPATQNPSGKSPIVDEPAAPGWLGGILQAHGMTLTWKHVGDLGDDVPEVGYFVQVTDQQMAGDLRTCEVSFDSRFYEMAEAYPVAYMVGSCFHRLWLEISYDEDLIHDPTAEANIAFSTKYADTYVERCGSLYEPLAWSGVPDGKCSLPDPKEVMLSLAEASG